MSTRSSRLSTHSLTQSIQNNHKLNAIQTYLTLLKGFIAIGCLYLPKAYLDGGLVFSTVSMTASALLIMYCAHLLIDSRKELNAQTYSELGLVALGPLGKILIDLTLALSQMGFVCAYVYFIQDNMMQIFGLQKHLILSACLVIFSLLCMIRRIEVFASTLIFADLMILITIVFIFIYGSNKISQEGPKLTLSPSGSTIS